MGVKYSASESSQLMEAMANNIQVANEVTDRLSQGCDHLIATLDSGELMGAAYTAGKGLFSEIIIPAIKKLQAAVDDIQTELNSYREADAQVSGFGDLDLDRMKETRALRAVQLSQIKEQIKEKDSFWNQLGAVVSGQTAKHISERSALSRMSGMLESSIRTLDEKIEKLEFFVDQVSQYFSDSLEVLRLAIQGASQLSQVLVDSDGNYSVDGLDMSWAEKIKKVNIKNMKYDSSDEGKNLHKNYQAALDKLRRGDKLSEKENQYLETYAKRYPDIELPSIVRERIESRKANKHIIDERNKKIEEIKKSDKSVTEKSEEIVKAYEDYLYNYGDNKKAFEEYAKARDEIKKKMESDGQEFKWEPREDGSPIQKEAYKIETKLANELSKSEVNMGETLQSMGNDVIEVAKKEPPVLAAIGFTLGSVPIVGIPAAPLVGTAPYQKQFYDLVQTGQPLDLKTRAYNDGNSYSLWARNWGGKYHDDYAGNYLYGYVGQGYLPVGTGSVLTDYLKQAAGVAQGISDKDFWKYWKNVSNGNWGDNPGDAQTIQDGADAYENREK